MKCSNFKLFFWDPKKVRRWSVFLSAATHWHSMWHPCNGTLVLSGLCTVNALKCTSETNTRTHAHYSDMLTWCLETREEIKVEMSAVCVCVCVFETGGERLWLESLLCSCQPHTVSVWRPDQLTLRQGPTPTIHLYSTSTTVSVHHRPAGCRF